MRVSVSKDPWGIIPNIIYGGLLTFAVLILATLIHLPEFWSGFLSASAGIAGFLFMSTTSEPTFRKCNPQWVLMHYPSEVPEGYDKVGEPVLIAESSTWLLACLLQQFQGLPMYLDDEDPHWMLINGDWWHSVLV